MQMQETKCISHCHPLDLLPCHIWGKVSGYLSSKDLVNFLHSSKAFYESHDIVCDMKHVTVCYGAQIEGNVVVGPATALPYIRSLKWCKRKEKLACMLRPASRDIDKEFRQERKDMKRLLARLPALVTLDIGFCDMKRLPRSLPESLENLVLNSCSTLLKRMPRYLPPCLKVLKCPCDDFNSFYKLPEVLPTGLRHLSFTSCRHEMRPLKVKEGYLPDSLEVLCVKGSIALPRRLPTGLRVLEITSVKLGGAIPSVPNIPEGLRRLMINGIVTDYTE